VAQMIGCAKLTSILASIKYFLEMYFDLEIEAGVVDGTLKVRSL